MFCLLRNRWFEFCEQNLIIIVISSFNGTIFRPLFKVRISTDERPKSNVMTKITTVVKLKTSEGQTPKAYCIYSIKQNLLNYTCRPTYNGYKMEMRSLGTHDRKEQTGEKHLHKTQFWKESRRQINPQCPVSVLLFWEWGWLASGSIINVAHFLIELHSRSTKIKTTSKSYWSSIEMKNAVCKQ